MKEYSVKTGHIYYLQRVVLKRLWPFQILIVCNVPSKSVLQNITLPPERSFRHLRVEDVIPILTNCLHMKLITKMFRENTPVSLTRVIIMQQCRHSTIHVTGSFFPRVVCFILRFVVVYMQQYVYTICSHKQNSLNEM